MSDERKALLVVEDDPGLQRQLRWSYENYDVHIAGDRATALELMRSIMPSVVTLDLGLPPDPDGTSEGFATLREIIHLRPDTKVIVASGHGARDSALKAISWGAYDFYHKPVDFDELGLIVRRAFHVAGLEAEARRYGSAIAIGHPHAATLSALAQWLPTASARGLRITTVAEIIKQRASPLWRLARAG